MVAKRHLCEPPGHRDGCAINARGGFQSFPLPRDIFCKVRRLSSPKAIQNQTLTSSVLNPRGREVWRQTARERKFQVSAGASKCGGLCAKPVVIGDFSALKTGREFQSQ